MYSTAGMKRELRKVLGQSPADWPVSEASCSRLRVRSSNAAAASALSTKPIAWFGKSGIAMGSSFAPALRNTSSASAYMARRASAATALEFLLDVANLQRREGQSARTAGRRRRRNSVPLQWRIRDGVVLPVAA